MCACSVRACWGAERQGAKRDKARGPSALALAALGPGVGPLGDNHAQDEKPLHGRPGSWQSSSGPRSSSRSPSSAPEFTTATA